MDSDAAHLLALQRMISDSAEIEVQFRKDIRGGRPVVTMLQKAREEAASSLVALVDANPDEPKEIRHHQNNVNRFRDLVRWLRQIVADGAEADKELDDQDREALIEYLVGSPEGQEEALGLGLVVDAPRDA